MTKKNQYQKKKESNHIFYSDNQTVSDRIFSIVLSLQQKSRSACRECSSIDVLPSSA